MNSCNDEMIDFHGDLSAHLNKYVQSINLTLLKQMWRKTKAIETVEMFYYWTTTGGQHGRAQGHLEYKAIRYSRGMHTVHTIQGFSRALKAQHTNLALYKTSSDKYKPYP